MSNTAPRVYDVPDRYPNAPTKAQRKVLKERRADFLAAPLAPGLRVPFVPQDDPCAWRPSGGGDPPIPSPNPRRLMNARLREAFIGARAASPFTVHLKEELAGGADAWSQVWRCAVERHGGVEGEVVVKLVVESLFPYPGETGLRRWKTAAEFAANEARAYAAFQPIQGTDVPYCYALGRFRMPNGEDVPGFLLEDLGLSAVTLRAACPWADDDDLEVQDIENLAYELFQGMRRLFACGVARFEFTEDDIFLLRKRAHPHPIFIDFGTSMLIEAFKEETREAAIRLEIADVEDFVRRWEAADEAHLSGAMDSFFPQAWAQWLRQEMLEEKRLGLHLGPLHAR